MTLDILWTKEGMAEHPVLTKWCAQRLWDDGRAGDFGNSTALGVVKGDKLISVVIFHNWVPESGVIEMSAAADDPIWLSRKVLLEMYGYIFDVCKCQMVVQRQSINNNRINRILRRFGYDEIKLPRMRGRNEDELLFTLTVEQWCEGMKRRLNHGQEIKRTQVA